MPHLSQLQQTSEVYGKEIIYCDVCNQPKALCICSNQGSGSSKKNNGEQAPTDPTLLFKDFILNAYLALIQKSFSDESTTKIQTEISQLTKIDIQKLKFDPSFLEKLLKVLGHLKSMPPHPDLMHFIEKIENKLRDYLKDHPNQMRPELTYLFDNQNQSLTKSKHSPFKTKPYPSGYGSR